MEFLFCCGGRVIILRELKCLLVKVDSSAKQSLDFFSCWLDRLVGLVVKASASRAEDPGSNTAGNRIFPGRVIPVT